MFLTPEYPWRGSPEFWMPENMRIANAPTGHEDDICGGYGNGELGTDNGRGYGAPLTAGQRPFWLGGFPLLASHAPEFEAAVFMQRVRPLIKLEMTWY